MDARDRKILAKLRRDEKLASPPNRSATFTSARDYARKPKHPGWYA